MARLIGTPEVARRLGLSVERLYRMRAALAAAGFPAPVPPFRTRWSDVQVDAWIAKGGNGATATTSATTSATLGAGGGADRVGDAAPPPDDDLARWQETLRARARAANL